MNIDSLDAVKSKNSAHILRKRVGIRPLEVVSDRNNVLLPIESGNNLLQITHTHCHVWTPLAHLITVKVERNNLTL